MCNFATVKRKQTKRVVRELRDYLIILTGMVMGSIGWCVFLLPNHITMGGVPGISSVVFWATGIPVQYTYFCLNALLLIAALWVLGFRFCVRTIFAVIIFTTSTALVQQATGGQGLFESQPTMACLSGSVLMGVGMGMALLCNASSGGSDVIASMVHKYRDYSLGHVILCVDLIVITSSFFVLRSWERVIYGYIVLFIMSYCVDWVINGVRQSVQFFVVSDKWEEIGSAINNDIDRGCTVIDARGFYTGRRVGMLFIIARRNESRGIFQVINDIDPNAFVSQSSVRGVYGIGFDRMKTGRINIFKNKNNDRLRQDKG